MTTTESSSSEQVHAEQVADYLRKHPDFLDQRPELLTTIALSHDTPAGVNSLIEKQVHVLRAENQRYRQRLNRLQTAQEDTRELTEHVHQLSLKILQLDQSENAGDLLHDFMLDKYEADCMTLMLFLENSPFKPTAIVDIRSRHDKLRLLLAELFNRKQPLLDSLQAEHLSLMFGATGDQIHSTILLPLIGRNWDGLLAVGSKQRNRYRRGPELELLVYLSRITAIRLDDCVRTNKN